MSFGERDVLVGDHYAYRGDLYVVLAVGGIKSKIAHLEGTVTKKKLHRRVQTIQYSTEWDFREEDDRGSH